MNENEAIAGHHSSEDGIQVTHPTIRLQHNTWSSKQNGQE